eukprot:3331794-Pyramimonas_sp.AAC.2
MAVNIPHFESGESGVHHRLGVVLGYSSYAGELELASIILGAWVGHSSLAVEGQTTLEANHKLVASAIDVVRGVVYFASEHTTNIGTQLTHIVALNTSGERSH